ncbi:MAG: hypothetical protein C4321_01040, partial [Chloroflexota bacterium]
MLVRVDGNVGHRIMAGMAAVAEGLKWLWRAGEAAALALSGYQSGVTLAGYLRGHPMERRDPEARWRPRFALVACARNEEAVIGRLVGDLFAQDYPAELRDVYVVAHNCSDGTAAA